MVAEKNDSVFCSVGIHVDEDKQVPLPELYSALSGRLSSGRKIIAVGECGIDISDWQGSRPLADQIELFEMQIQLALDHRLPVIIHNRNGDDAVIKLLRQYVPRGLRGIAHSFSQTWEYGKMLLDLGIYLSFSGMITYKGRRDVLETVKNTPQDMILSETDAPYLPPDGFRGQPNEPKNVVAVVRKIAETRAVSQEHMAVIIDQNAKTIFKFD